MAGNACGGTAWLQRSGDPLWAGASKVVEGLRRAGYEAYLAGGCVRDLLLGAVPKDYDVVTDARPELVAKCFRRTHLVGAAFGVVRVQLSRDLVYEVATYRGDGAYADGRRPEAVVYGVGKEEDVHRRDFTINAMLLDPLSGELIDLVGGRADLEQRLIRAVGDPKLRFEEDHLRLLRAVRFATRLGFEIEAATAEAMRASAPKLSRISRERISTELDGIWISPAPDRGLRLLGDFGLVAAALPLPIESLEAEAIEAKAHALGRLRRSVADDVAKSDLVRLAWAVLLEGLERAQVHAALTELRRSREELRVIGALVDAAPVLRSPERYPTAETRRLVADVAFWPLAKAYLCALVDDSSLRSELEEPRTGVVAVRGPRAFFAREERELEERPLAARPIVTGADLKALGLNAGPVFKTLLDEVDRAVLERRVTSRAEALAFVRTSLASKGLDPNKSHIDGR
ncbi:MAG: CCA tRNA nucleotidyltransferase [Deltaproteobacteria bacterium]|nr:CCA tRNA nucleotidyltransferase [Deltaproteobacteria bacterium]